MDAIWFHNRMKTMLYLFVLVCLVIVHSATEQKVKAASESSPFPSAVQSSPQWKILILIYTSTDFTYNDDTGQHHVVASMTQGEIDRATTASNTFVNIDIPLLTSGNMIPLITIRKLAHPLTSFESACGYWPHRVNTIADLDPAFDSVLVIWDDSGTDLITGQPADLNGCGGLALPNGTGQTYAAIPVDSVASNDRNVFKHEWGHSILFYFEAAGVSPLPTVDNHINDTTIRYVHCPSGAPYILQDETDDNPIPNSIYNNHSGFTHDYYSGTTAKPEAPTQCLGITPTAWSSGGPATKPLRKDTAGVFRPSNGALYLKNTNTTGFADVQINYGISGDYPVVGDWDGDGTSTIGIYRNGSFYLRNSNTIGFADWTFPFGAPGDQPVAGDWDGDGIDTIGVYRNGTFFLRDSNSAGTPDAIFGLGIPGDVGIAGDWNGDGMDTTGVFRPSNGALYLKNQNTTGFADIQINYGIGGDKPVTGDWNDDGIDTIGVYRDGVFYLRNTNDIGFADIVFALGIPGDHPIAGNWDGQP